VALRNATAVLSFLESAALPEMCSGGGDQFPTVLKDSTGGSESISGNEASEEDGQKRKKG
jgi:hypothetical protein